MCRSAPYALAQLANGGQAVVAELLIHRDREHERVHVDVRRRDAALQRGVHHPRRVRHPLGGVVRHARLAGGGHYRLHVELARQVKRVEPLQGGGVEQPAVAVRAVAPRLQPGPDDVDVGRVDRQRQAARTPYGPHQPAHRLLLILPAKRNLVHIEVEKVGAGVLLALRQTLQVTEPLGRPGALRHRLAHRNLHVLHAALLEILGGAERLRDWQMAHLPGPGAVVHRLAAVGKVADSAALAAQHAGRVDVLADHDEGIVHWVSCSSVVPPACGAGRWRKWSRPR